MEARSFVEDEAVAWLVFLEDGFFDKFVVLDFEVGAAEALCAFPWAVSRDGEKLGWFLELRTMSQIRLLSSSLVLRQSLSPCPGL